MKTSECLSVEDLVMNRQLQPPVNVISWPVLYLFGHIFSKIYESRKNHQTIVTI